MPVRQSLLCTSWNLKESKHGSYIERNCIRKGGKTKPTTDRIMAKPNLNVGIHVWCGRGMIDAERRNSFRVQTEGQICN